VDLTRPGLTTNLAYLTPRSQVAVSGSLVSVFPPSWPSVFSNSHLPGDPGIYQACHEIKAIMAFSFLLWILRSSIPSVVFCTCLTIPV